MTESVGFTDVTGFELEAYPLVAERLAIDATNALRGAEAGLRGLRGRVLLRRLWDDLSGRGQELQAAVGQDLLTVQRATLDIVREVMREEARTQYCVSRVLTNLLAINQDQDALSASLRILEQDQRQLRGQLLDLLSTESARLSAEIEGCRRELRRHAETRHLTERYRADDLHPGAGEILSAGLFLAAIGQQCWHCNAGQRQEEWRTASAVVRARLGARPVRIEEGLLEATEQASATALEPLLYLQQQRGPFSTTLGMLTARRLAGLARSEQSAVEALAVTRALHDPDHRLASALIRPWELAEAIGRELTPSSEERHE